MKVKIVRCSGVDYWYRDKIGQTFKVKPEASMYRLTKKEFKKVKTTTHTYCTGYAIDFYDAEIVESNEWKPLTVECLPEIYKDLKGYEFQFCKNDLWYPTDYWQDIDHFHIQVKKLLDETFKYRYRKLPSVEELAEEYANSKTCYKTPIKDAYIAGYKEAKK